MITSLSNPTIKQLRRLQQRKERERSGLCFVEGIRLVVDAVQVGAPLEMLVVAPELLSSGFARQVVAEQRAAGVACLEVSAAVFRSLASKEGPQGLAAVARQQWAELADVRLATGPGWVALEGVQDPGNLGTILRTCDAVGMTGVLLLGASTDPYDPAALRGSMGAVFGQQLVRATVADFAAWQAQHGYPLVGTAGAAAQDFQDVRYQLPLVLLMGSEQKGLSAELLALCTQVVSLPMRGRSDSLNLAVATGVMLYELLRQQRGAGA
jgi:TrmH family RNA methyltransferase